MAASTRWNVYLDGRKFTTVYYDSDMTAEEVKRSLVNHDGFDSRIEVRRG